MIDTLSLNEVTEEQLERFADGLRHIDQRWNDRLSGKRWFGLSEQVPGVF